MSTQVSNPYSFNKDENNNHFIGVPATTSTFGLLNYDKFMIIPDRKSSSVIGWDAEEGYGQIKRISKDNIDNMYKYSISCIRLLEPSSIFLGICDSDFSNKFAVKIGDTKVICSFFSNFSSIYYYKGNIKNLGISFEVGVPIVVEISW